MAGRTRLKLVALCLAGAVIGPAQEAHAAAVVVSVPTSANTATSPASVPPFILPSTGSATYSITFPTNCGTQNGTWQVTSTLPTGVTGAFPTGQNTGNTGILTLTATTAALVRDLNITVQFTRSTDFGNTPCDSSLILGTSSGTQSIRLPIIYKYPASNFGSGATRLQASLNNNGTIYASKPDTNQVFSKAASNPPASGNWTAATAFTNLAFPSGLAFSGTQTYATNYDGNATAVSTATGTVVNLPGCKNATGISPNAANTFMFVSCSGSNGVYTFTPSGTSVSAPFALPNSGIPGAVARIQLTDTSAQQLVLVADARNNLVYAMAPSGSTAAPAPVPGVTPVSLPSGCTPANIAVAPTTAATTVAYVACPGTDSVVPINLATSPQTFTAGTAIPVGDKPYGLALNTGVTPNNLVVANAGDDTIHVVNTNSVKQTIVNLDPANNQTIIPDQVSVVPGNPATAYVTGDADGSMYVVDPPVTEGKVKKVKTKAKTKKVMAKAKKHEKHHSKRRAKASSFEHARLIRNAEINPLGAPR